jgi:hypothetical protein
LKVTDLVVFAVAGGCTHSEPLRTSNFNGLYIANSEIEKIEKIERLLRMPYHMSYRIVFLKSCLVVHPVGGTYRAGDQLAQIPWHNGTRQP